MLLADILVGVMAGVEVFVSESLSATLTVSRLALFDGTTPSVLADISADHAPTAQSFTARSTK